MDWTDDGSLGHLRVVALTTIGLHGSAYLLCHGPGSYQLRGATFRIVVFALARQIARRAGIRLSGLAAACECFLDLAHVAADGVQTSQDRLLEGLAGGVAASGSQ